VDRIREFFTELQPFRCVIEASASYRWLYDLLAPLGEVLLAHPRHLRAIVTARAKTDKLDAALLARLLRGDLIPRAYVPPAPYARLRDLTRGRAQLSRHVVEAKNELHALLARANLGSPFVNPFCKQGFRWIADLDLGSASNLARDELLERIQHFDQSIARFDKELRAAELAFPQIEALLDIRGVGRYTALLIVAEIGEPGRFREGRQVAAYAGLTPRVRQSGETCYHGHITRQGSCWLRWILIQAAIHATRHDPQIENFYRRIRKRSSAKIARVALARKLGVICWVRLKRWEEQQRAAA